MEERDESSCWVTVFLRIQDTWGGSGESESISLHRTRRIACLDRELQCLIMEFAKGMQHECASLRHIKESGIVPWLPMGYAVLVPGAFWKHALQRVKLMRTSRLICLCADKV